ncbi:MAG: YIP1 family protein [Candidatus Promineifilaceae bacterium]|jgi:hypothetical protein
MLDRLRGVLSFNLETINEIEHDPSALSQAFIVVIVSSLVAAIGGGFGQVLFGVGIGTDSNNNPALKFVSIVVWAIVAWFLWAVITQFIGTKFFNGEATIPEMMRVIGFAYAPLVIQVFSFIPFLGFLFVFGAAAWSIALVFVSVREGLDISTGSALWVALIGGVVYLIGMGVILTIF